MKRRSPGQDAPAYFETTSEPPPLLWPPSVARTQKKKSAKQRPWRGDAFWETSTFAYAPRYALVRYQTTTQKLQKIAREVLYWQEGESGKAMHLFDTLPSHLRHHETMQMLQNIAREVLSEHEHAHPPPGSKEPAKPTPGVERAQLQELEKIATPYLRCLQGLHSPTRNALELATATLPKPSRLDIDELIKKHSFFLSTVRRLLLTDKRPTGRPQNEVMRRWVWRLCDWWVRSIGETPRSSHNPKTGQYSSEFHNFAVAAISPALGDRGLDAVIEKVVMQWRRANASESPRKKG